MALSPHLRALVSQSKAKYANNDSKTLKPKEGRTTWRIIAPKAAWVQNEQFWAESGVHWIKASEDGKALAVVGDCEVVYGKPSAINAAINLAIDTAVDETSKKLYQSWKSRRTIMVNVVDRATDQNGILELTSTTFGKYLDLMQMYDDEGHDITDPMTGIDIVITRSGKGLQTEYAITPAISSKPLTKDQIDKAEDLHAFIAGAYFRGEEQKALNAIQQIAGIAVPAVGVTRTNTPTAALTSSAAVVEDAVVEAPPAVDPAIAARRAEILAKQKKMVDQAAADAAELAELEAAEAAPVTAPVTSAATSVSGLSKSEEDDILAELDKLT